MKNTTIALSVARNRQLPFKDRKAALRFLRDVNRGRIAKRSLRVPLEDIDFRTHPKFAKCIYFAFRPFRWVLHAWDYAVADRWMPELSFGFATLTAYPDPGTGATTVDGVVGCSFYKGAWSDVTKGVGDTARASGASDYALMFYAMDLPWWYETDRSIFLFDTSPLTAGSVISASTFSLWATAKGDSLGATPNTAIYSTNPASNNSLTGADFSTFGSTIFSAAVTWASITTGAYNDYAFVAAGIAAISKTSISKFGIRNPYYDVGAIEPPKVANVITAIVAAFADTTGTTNDPKLVVTYTMAYTEAAIVSIGAAATETEALVMTESATANLAVSVTETEVKYWAEDRTVSAAVAVTEADLAAFLESAPAVSLAVSVTETDVGVFLENPVVSVAVAVTEVENKTWTEAPVVSATVAVTEADLAAFLETPPALPLAVSITETDTGAFLDNPVVSATAAVAEADAKTWTEAPVVSAAVAVTEIDNAVRLENPVVSVSMVMTAASWQTPGAAWFGVIHPEG